jgi:hypothetical protein
MSKYRNFLLDFLKILTGKYLFRNQFKNIFIV